MESSLPNGGRTSPHPLPSLPSSPTTSEDLGRAHVWAEPEDTDEPENIPQKKDKGKAREIVSLVVEGVGNGDTSEEEGGGAYPPTTEDAAETQKIEDVSLERISHHSLNLYRLPVTLESTAMGISRKTTTESSTRECTTFVQIIGSGCNTACQSIMVWKN
jgi:hypothetical protein